MALVAATSWPEVADGAVQRIPLDDLRIAFWLGVALVIGAAWLHVRRLLKTPTAAEIAAELDALNKGSRRASPAELEAAVQRGINGTAERVQRIEAAVGDLAKQVAAIDDKVDARHADNQREFGELRGALGRIGPRR